MTAREQALQIDREDEFPVLLLRLQKGLDHVDASVVDQDVDWPELLFDVGQTRFDVDPTGNVDRR